MLATNGSPHTEAPLKIDDRSLQVGGAVDQVVDWELRLAGRPGQRTAGPTGATVHEPSGHTNDGRPTRPAPPLPKTAMTRAYALVMWCRRGVRPREYMGRCCEESWCSPEGPVP
jgi:hypothetical protein